MDTMQSIEQSGAKAIPSPKASFFSKHLDMMSFIRTFAGRKSNTTANK